MRRSERRLIGLFWLLLLGLSCVGPTDTPTGAEATVEGPRIRVMGTAQDGGYPHAACRCANCILARENPRLVAGLAIILPASGKTYLIDATPDIRLQIEALADVRNPSGDRVDRAPVDGVFLTHAHMGHYTGLAFFGFEAIHTQELPVYCSRALAGFLRDNGPWSQLVRIGNIVLHESTTGEPIALGEGVTVTPIDVPHRDEYTDTVGFLIEGPTRRVLYVPDTDGWQHWSPPLEEQLADVDVAILDGTFFSLDELPGRDLASIGHPLMRDTMERLRPAVDSGKLEVYFTHLNHSNPAMDPDSDQRAEVNASGFAVLNDGRELSL